ncbi:hypothetical protein DSCW_07720 [Desulfosarcina widdelii]|uniref:Uncharacterized protein n=1 Tax=Desulfosarcina widdelii TaxID=947919 RepID=A0A5K7YY62_9BACT|nr:hypothetical protein [Desulfosarcina widdelii]BBO73355.1 hypothetical protein DSCW_07720 [Desulfosarcina widdelii]
MACIQAVCIRSAWPLSAATGTPANGSHPMALITIATDREPETVTKIGDPD